MDMHLQFLWMCAYQAAESQDSYVLMGESGFHNCHPILSEAQGSSISMFSCSMLFSVSWLVPPL